MNCFSPVIKRVSRVLLVATCGAAALVAASGGALAQHDDHGATPESEATIWSCDTIATPAAGHDGHAAENGDTDHANHADAEFDQLYIDMMLPHHGSIIALSEAALPHLTDPRLQELAREIIAAQTAENAQLTEWRAEWYDSGEPATDEATMEMMLGAMPIGTMDEMMGQMDATSQVSMFCAADDPDLAFIEQTIPHHQMAIDASEFALDEAVNPELVAFAEDVIAAQQAEIDLLNEILAELESEATPAS